MPVKLNKHSGKESALPHAFSDQNWGSVMQKFTEWVKKWTAAQIAAIIDVAQGTLLTLTAKHDVSWAEGTAMSDAYNEICKSTYTAATWLTVDLSLL